MNLAVLEQAEAAYARGDLIKAQSLLDYEVSVRPDNVDALTMLGIVHGRARRAEQGVTFLRRALELDPDKGEAHIALASMLAALGDPEAAVFHAQEACRIMPDDSDTWNHLGLTLVAVGRRAEAVSAFQVARNRNPNHPSALQNLAAALKDSGREAEAITAWQEVIRRFPNNLVAHMSLGQLFMAHGRFDEAVIAAKGATRSAPNSPQAHLLLALALAESGKSDLAEPSLRRTLSLDPNEGIAHASLGFWLQEQGRFEEAQERLEDAVRLKPTHGFAHYNLFRSRKASDADRPRLDELERSAADPKTHPRDVGYMHYALGKAREDLGEYEAAMSHYDEANRLAYQSWIGSQGWDRESYTTGFSRKIESPLAPAGSNESEMPVFIVGMIRSGTSLVEQILSSHPEVGGAGEQTFWHENEGREDHEAVAQEYLRLLTKLMPGKARVTDKLPHNYSLLGAIHTALPRARIIHLRRNPVDNCLSVYTTAYQRPPVFAHDKSNIVFAYREYLRIMDHWRNVLPQDRLLEVDYEALVADRQGETRRMIEFLGLEWNEALLHHESNKRSVRTPSLWQVRQPVYATSVERWRRFEPWIGELADAGS